MFRSAGLYTPVAAAFQGTASEILPDVELEIVSGETDNTPNWEYVVNSGVISAGMDEHWQYTLSTDTGFAAPVQDFTIEISSGELTDGGGTTTGGTPLANGDYLGRLRIENSSVEVTNWSSAVAFTIAVPDVGGLPSLDFSDELNSMYAPLV